MHWFDWDQLTITNYEYDSWAWSIRHFCTKERRQDVDLGSEFGFVCINTTVAYLYVKQTRLPLMRDCMLFS